MNSVRLANTFLDAVAPASADVAMVALKVGEAEYPSALKQFRSRVERARCEAQRGERRYRSVEPENRLVARTLETEWENKLQEQRATEAQSAPQEWEQRLQPTEAQSGQIRAVGGDSKRVWTAPMTTDRDRKELLHSLLEEVKTKVLSDQARAHLPYPDTVITGGLNRQGAKTARGGSFTANRIASLRHNWKVVCYQASATALAGEWLTVEAAAGQPGIAASTLPRWLNDGFITGERVTSGTPWRIRMTQQLNNLIVPEVPPGYAAMPQATRILGISRPTIMQRVKPGELSAVRASRGKQRGLRIRVLDKKLLLLRLPSAAKV